MSTDQNDNKTSDLFVSEAQDGTATVSLPDDLALPAEEPAEQAAAPVVHEDDDAADAAAEAAEIAATGSVDPEAEAIRAAKRAKRKARKEYHRQVQTEKDIRLQNLQRQNQELLERLSVIEKKTQSSELARVDKAIEDQQLRVDFAKRKMQEATESMNGELLTQAQEMWFEARRQVENLEAMKKHMVQPDRPQTIKQDPLLQRYASSWMEANPWYDPQGSDMDSKIALTVDQTLAEEGWDPKTAEYWEELDNRLSKVLPNRYTDFTSEKPPVRKPPKSVVTSSGREASSSAKSNQIVLSREQVQAMKEAGFWDDPEKRARMIKRYAMDARQNRS
jgi:hypothetical protein